MSTPPRDSARPPRVAHPDVWAAAREALFPRAWHLVATLADLPVPGSVAPIVLLPGVLDEPLILVRSEAGTIRAFSNVCTHRGAILVDQPGCPTALRCPYHGRRFGLDGRMRHAPEFETSPDFPGAEDHLPEVAVGVWGPFIFVSLDPLVPFTTLIQPVETRCGFLPIGDFQRDPTGDAVYEIEANWALWCENYLEGFHVPWVHPGLAAALDWRSYRTETVAWAVIQIGVASDGERFTLPEGHPDHGHPVVALYFHLLPFTTLNFYPWGLSVNVVEPLGPTRTRIRYQTWVWRPELRGFGAGGALNDVELEDDAIVERVQRGVRSRLYRPGRYAPAWEEGVRHFHALLRELGVVSD